MTLDRKSFQGRQQSAARTYTEILIEHWTVGQRHKLTWAYVSELHKAGCSLDGALQKIDEITQRASDEEARDRIRVARDIYEGKCKLAPDGYVNKMLRLSLDEARKAAILDMSPEMQFVFWRFSTGYYCVGKRCPDYQNCPYPFARDARKGKRGGSLLR